MVAAEFLDDVYKDESFFVINQDCSPVDPCTLSLHRRCTSPNMAAAPAIALIVVAVAPFLAFCARLVCLSRSSTASDKVAPQGGVGAADSLKAAKAHAARITFGIKGGACTVGFGLWIIGASNWFLPYEVWPVQFMSLMPLWPAGLTLALLSIRPVDKIGVRIGGCVVFFLSLFFCFNIFDTAQQSIPTTGNWVLIVYAPLVVILLANALSVTPVFLFCPGCGCDSRVMDTRKALGWWWLRLRIFATATCAFFGVWIVITATGTGPVVAPNGTTGGDPRDPVPGDPNDLPGAIATMLVLFVVGRLNPRIRRKFHAYLGSLACKGEAKAAAAVAGLVGGRSPEAALRHGTDTFRGLPLASLSLTDLSTSGDTGLHTKTKKAQLGDVHAFLSHSWHDDAAAKWQALEGWGASLSEPMLWLDKACIDQQKIDESLAALPVYLSGCQALLVVAGPTYTHRLWCVMELFVFLQMGGSLERVTALTMPGKEVQQELAAFDAAAAQCFKPEDRARLLAIIESAFGDFAAFNAKVRGIFQKRSATLEELPPAAGGASP